MNIAKINQTEISRAASQTNRLYYLDLLRIISITAVILLHSASQYWSGLNPESSDWLMVNIYHSATRWSVPVFVMISGVLFLNPERPQPIKKLWQKNILKIVIITIIWSLIYTLEIDLYHYESFDSVYLFLHEWMHGRFHMWFLFMLIGLYICTPILRLITQNQTIMKYYLLLAFVVGSVVPFITSFGHLAFLSELTARIDFGIVIGYSFYYVLGYYISTINFTKRIRILFYGGGLAGVLATILLTQWISTIKGTPDSTFYNNFFPTILITSIAMVLLVRQFMEQRTLAERTKRVLITLSNCTLGAYLIHILVRDTLQKFGLDTMIFNPAFAIPLVGCLVVFLSYGCSFLLNKIPFINKYIV